MRVRILDENGTPAPYAQFPVQFTVEGNAALVGPQTAVAEGGMTGTYLRTVGAAGELIYFPVCLAGSRRRRSSSSCTCAERGGVVRSVLDRGTDRGIVRGADRGT